MSYSFRPGVQHALLIVHSRVHMHNFVIYCHVFLVVLFSLTQVYVSSLLMNELKMPSSYTSAFYPAIKRASSEHPSCTKGWCSKTQTVLFLSRHFKSPVFPKVV